MLFNSLYRHKQGIGLKSDEGLHVVQGEATLLDLILREKFLLEVCSFLRQFVGPIVKLHSSFLFVTAVTVTVVTNVLRIVEMHKLTLLLRSFELLLIGGVQANASPSFESLFSQKERVHNAKKNTSNVKTGRILSAHIYSIERKRNSTTLFLGIVKNRTSKIAYYSLFYRQIQIFDVRFLRFSLLQDVRK